MVVISHFVSDTNNVSYIATCSCELYKGYGVITILLCAVCPILSKEFSFSVDFFFNSYSLFLRVKPVSKEGHWVM